MTSNQIIHREQLSIKSNLSLRTTYLVILFFILSFIADGMNQVLISLGFSFYRISIFIRFIGLILFLLLLTYKHRVARIFEILVFFYLIFFIGTFAAWQNYQNYLLFENFSMITKMLFFFVILQVLFVTFTKPHDRDTLFNVFEFLILLQSIVVILSFIFKIDIFASYQNQIRFGYSGLIPARNEASAFYIIGFFFFLYRFHHERTSIFKLLTVTLAALLTGTKVALIIPLILSFYVIRAIFRGIMLKKMNRRYLLASALLLVIVLFTISQLDFILTQIKPTINYYSSFITDFNYTTFDIIASGRQFKIHEFVSKQLPNFNIINYLFGGHDIASYPTESDLIDMFIRLGLIGGLGFYYLYIKTILPFGNPFRLTHFLFVLVWLVISSIAGHIAFSAINGGYLAILIFYMLTYPHSHEISKKKDFNYNPIM